MSGRKLKVLAITPSLQSSDSFCESKKFSGCDDRDYDHVGRSGCATWR